MDPFHERLARVALDVAASYGFALAGGYAVQAHGFLDRPSTDVDLFAEASAHFDFSQAVDAVIAAYRRDGLEADAEVRSSTFARLSVSSGEERAKVELGVDWRKNEPILLAVGPVLHADDAVANKVCALFGRALPRDFLDVDAAISSGRYTREQLLELAAEADHGFDRLLFADALGALTQITDAAFAEYRADPGMIADMRHRF